MTELNLSFRNKMNGWKFIHRLSAFVGFLIVIASSIILFTQLKDLDLHELFANFSALDRIDFIKACVASAISYLAVANYDRLAVQHFKLPLRWQTVLPLGFCATAIGHNLGAGIATGGAFRYRLYSRLGISTVDIAKIILFCAITFFLGGTLLLGLLLLFSGDINTTGNLMVTTIPHKLLYFLFVPSLIFLCLSAASGTTSLPAKFRAFVPSTPLALRQLFWSVTELSCAAAVLYFLLPAATQISFPLLLAVYLLALFTGGLSASPGGIGVFESMLLLLLPDIHTEGILSAVVIYRLLYHLLPLIITLLICFRYEKLSSRFIKG